MSIKSTLKRIYIKHLKAKNLRRWKKCGDEVITKERWKKVYGYDIDLDNPKTLNEKIQWLKLHDHKDIYTIWADKYGCREYIKEHFGEGI